MENGNKNVSVMVKFVENTDSESSISITFGYHLMSEIYDYQYNRGGDLLSFGVFIFIPFVHNGCT